MKRLISRTCLAVGLLLGGCGKKTSPPEPAPAPTPAATPAVTGAMQRAMQSVDAGAAAQPILDKAFAYLKTQQKADFGWQNPGEPPGMTAIVLKAFMGATTPQGKLVYDADDPFLDKAFDHLKAYQKPDGGIYDQGLEVYNTALAISAMAVSTEGEYKPIIAKALAYLRTKQWIDTVEGVDPTMKVTDKDKFYGGFGYSQKGRPDLSNLQIALDALHDAGIKPDDPAYQAAIKFVSRCQNSSETNDQTWAGDDGGFIYTDADGGNSPAGETTGPNGQKMLRSYGSMTYAGFKSMLYAGLSKDDPRVKAAWNWIQKNYALDKNPGMIGPNPNDEKRGLYYYYMTMSRALRAYGEPIITDAQGNKHDWRMELIGAIGGLQQADGSVKQFDKHWFEDSPVLDTTYCVLSLEEAQKDLRERPGK